MDAVFNILTQHPTFLLTSDLYMLHEVRSLLPYSDLSHSTVIEIEDTVIQFLCDIRATLDPLIKFCQTKTTSNGNTIDIAIRDNDAHSVSEKELDELLEDVQTLQAKFEDIDDQIAESKRKIQRLNALSKIIATRSIAERDSFKSQDDAAKHALQAQEKRRRALVQQSEKLKKRQQTLEADSTILARSIIANNALIDKYEKIRQQTRSGFDKIATSAQRSTFINLLWERLASVHFHVRELLSQEALNKQLDDYVTEHPEPTPPPQCRSKRKSSTRKDTYERKRDAQKCITQLNSYNLSRLLQRAFVRDETRGHVTMENKLVQFDKKIAGIDNRKRDLETIFVAEAKARTESSEENIRSLGEEHYNLYQKILKSFDAEKVVLMARKAEAQNELIEDLFADAGIS